MADPPAKPPPLIPMAAALVAMLLGPLVWVGCYLWFDYAYVGGLAIGLMIGLAVKFTSKRPDMRLALAAIVMTVLGAWVGYIWTDQIFYPWKPQYVPSIGQSAVHFLSDISALLFTALGAWLAYTLAKQPAGTPHAPEQP